MANTTTDTHDVAVRDYGPCAACEAGEASAHTYEHACECSEDYGPCELHCDLLAGREGASLRTADQLARVFVDDAVDAGVVLDAEDVAFLAEVDAALDAAEDACLSTWLDDDLSQQLSDFARDVEGRLEAWVIWDDGYRIVRVTGGLLA